MKADFRFNWPAIVIAAVILVIVCIAAPYFQHRANVADARYQKERHAWCLLTGEVPAGKGAAAVKVIRTAYRCP